MMLMRSGLVGLNHNRYISSVYYRLYSERFTHVHVTKSIPKKLKSCHVDGHGDLVTVLT